VGEGRGEGYFKANILDIKGCFERRLTYPIRLMII
jgi:hypothetical protein